MNLNYSWKTAKVAIVTALATLVLFGVSSVVTEIEEHAGKR